MRARTALFHETGEPRELRRHRVPQPAGSEVLGRISACTLCRRDLHTYSGRRSQPMPTAVARMSHLIGVAS